jgi:small-conductance mechanosensitive channel
MLAALIARLLAHTIVKEVIVRIMFKKLFARILASKIAKGKLTFASLAIALVPVLDQVTGANIESGEVATLVAGIGALGVIIGKLRAVHQASL